MKINSINDVKFENIKTTLSKFSGETAVYIYCIDSNKKLEAPESLRVKYSEDLINELSNILGNENIKFIK